MIVLTSCSKDDILDTDSGNAPSSIVGDSLLLYNSNLLINERAYNFTSQNKCNVRLFISGTSFIVTPTYSYAKKDKDDANFELRYKEKFTSLSYTWFHDYTYIVYLNFTSKTKGTYTATKKVITTGSSNETKTLSGTFALYND